MVNSAYKDYNCMKHSKFGEYYGKLRKCSAPATTQRGSNGVIYPKYGETDTRMNEVNQIAVANQIMNNQAQDYQYYLASGMGPV